MSVTTPPRARTVAPPPATTTVTVAAVEDHPVVVLGLQQMLGDAPGLRMLGGFPTVEALLAAPERADVVLLDLMLADRSAPAENVSRLRAAGARVVAYTAGESRYLLRLAAEAGVHGVVLKSAGRDALLDAVAAAARGDVVVAPPRRRTGPSGEYVAILSRRERETLALYASGEKSETVAERLGISQETVNDYVGRIRAKYRRAGRAADTKIDLYKRAVEDGILPAPGFDAG